MWYIIRIRKNLSYESELFELFSHGNLVKNNNFHHVKAKNEYLFIFSLNSKKTTSTNEKR